MFLEDYHLVSQQFSVNIRQFQKEKLFGRSSLAAYARGPEALISNMYDALFARKSNMYDDLWSVPRTARLF